MNPNLLTPVDSEAVDSEVLARIERTCIQAQRNCTLYRGKVTGQLWVVFHIGEEPSEQYLANVEAEEEKALPTAGAMQ